MNWKIPGMPRRWAILLICSLALNLLVAGAAVGIYVNWPQHQYRQAERFLGPAGLGIVARSLDDHHRQELGKTIASDKKAIGGMRRDGQEKLRKMVEILNADPLDSEALAAEFAAQQDAAAMRLKRGHELIAAAISEMTPEERRSLSERLERAFERGGKMRK